MRLDVCYHQHMQSASDGTASVEPHLYEVVSTDHAEETPRWAIWTWSRLRTRSRGR
jgi:hypothetical protein